MLDFFDSALLLLAQVAEPNAAQTAADISNNLNSTGAVDAAASLAGATADAINNGASETIGATVQLNEQLLAQENSGGMLHFIEQSDLLGKSLFGFLLLMSLASWYLIIVKGITHLRIRNKSKKFLAEFWAASSLEQVENEIATHGANEPFAHLASHAIHAQRHHAKYGGLKLEESGSTSSFVTRIIRKVIDEETARLENGLTLLASVGSTAPFVGLFGTVWGIYHALLSISMSNGVTIDRIAGPVGEALIMTGLGLAVAIPAVLAYNGFVRINRVYLARLDAFAHDLFTFLTTGQQVSENQREHQRDHHRDNSRHINLVERKGA